MLFTNYLSKYCEVENITNIETNSVSTVAQDGAKLI